MTIKPSTNLSGLISTKGSAAPAVPQKIETAREVPAPPKEKPMLAKSEPQGSQTYWKSMTVKLNQQQYMDLKIQGVQLNKTSQQCMSEAIDLWLSVQKGD